MLMVNRFMWGVAVWGDLLEKLEARYGSVELEAVETKEYDVLGSRCWSLPGATAAIYSARKGLKVAIIADVLVDKSMKRWGLRT